MPNSCTVCLIPARSLPVPFPVIRGSGCTVCLAPAQCLPVPIPVSISLLRLLQISPNILLVRKGKWLYCMFDPCSVPPCPLSRQHRWAPPFADFASDFPGKEGSGQLVMICFIPARSIPVSIPVSIDGLNLLQISPKIFLEKKEVVNLPLYVLSLLDYYLSPYQSA